jgi:hypothetical protein
MDQVLASEVRNVDDLAELAGLVHCAALATCQVLGCKTRDETNATRQKIRSEEKSISTCKKRIEEKINRARRDIAHLAEYFPKKLEHCRLQ